MNSDYLLGKDVAAMQESLRRVEGRLDSMEGLLAGRGAQDLSGVGLFSPGQTTLAGGGPPPADTKDGEKLAAAATISWSATDVINNRRVRTPDRAAEFVYFGYLITALPDNPAAVTDTIWPDVQRLWRDDTSVPLRQDYRPTGYRGNCAVLGYYSRTLSWWTWIAISFLRRDDNPNARFSTAYNMEGRAILSKRGWDPNVIITAPASGRYRSTVRYADSDREEGIHFAFLDLVMQ